MGDHVVAIGDQAPATGSGVAAWGQGRVEAAREWYAARTEGGKRLVKVGLAVGCVAFIGVIAAAASAGGSGEGSGEPAARASEASGIVNEVDLSDIPPPEKCNLEGRCTLQFSEGACKARNGCTWDYAVSKCFVKEYCECYDRPQEGCPKGASGETSCDLFEACVWDDLVCQERDDCPWQFFATLSPTSAPTTRPTASPTATPTATPSRETTLQPTRSPNSEVARSESPSVAPSLTPTAAPSSGPTALPTVWPTQAPTLWPTQGPTKQPTTAPSAAPTPKLTVQPRPTPKPTVPGWTAPTTA